MNLFQLLPENGPPRPGLGGLERLADGSPDERSEGAPDQFRKFPVFEIPGRGKNQLPAPIAGLEVTEEIIAAEGFDPFLRPENGQTEGMSFPEHPFEQIMDVIVGGIFDHPDLLEDHRPLPVDILLGKARTGENIGQKIDGHLQVVIRDLDVEGGHLLPRGGVHHPAHGIDGGGNIEGGPAFGPLEQHVFDEMGHPVVQAVFQAGAPFHPGPDGDRPDMVDLLGNHPDAVVQDGLIDHFLPALPSG